ncbi:MAG: hypothetical protein VX294_09205 [Candidatus Latescibacterota bacterium]|nr:hypothetical protein [Candidatus Latescibacterota bacterium]
MMYITESMVQNFSMGDFIWGCDRAFHLFNRGIVKNLPRQERVEKREDMDRFRLEMCSIWPDSYKACKIIEEQSDITTGSLAHRTAFVDFQDTKNNVSVKLDAGNLTDMRTGAAGALALKYVTTCPLRRIAIIGTGRVARRLAIACDMLFELEYVSCTSRKRQNREAFFCDIKDNIKAGLKMFPTIEECLRGVDAVLMAVPTSSPIIDDSVIDRVSYWVVIGGDSRTRQVPQRLLEQYPIVVDEVQQAKKSGEFIWAQDQGREDSLVFSQTASGELLTLNEYALLQSETNQAVIYLTGLAIHDLCSAAMIYEKIACIEEGPMSYVK